MGNGCTLSDQDERAGGASGYSFVSMEAELCRALLGCIGDAVVVVDPDGKVRRLNPSAETLLGWLEAEAIGQAVGVVVKLRAQAGQGEHEDWVAHVVHTAVTVTLPQDARVVTRGGNEVPIVGTCAPVHDARLALAGAVLVLRERAASTEAIAQLERDERRFRTAFACSPVGKSLTTVDGSLQVNQALCDLLGYSEDELRARRWQDITHPDDIRETEEAIARLITGQDQTARFEKRYLHKSGATVWCDMATVLHRDEQGNPEFFLTSVLDITFRKRLEDQIRHLSLVLRAIRDVNHVIAREKDATALIGRTCEILTGTRGYSSAWIMLLDDAGRWVQGVSAQVGENFPFLEARLREGKLGACARALARSGVHVIGDPAVECPGCPALPRYGGQSAMAVRLEHEGQVLGLLVVAVAAELAGLAQEQSLAQEVADDIAYALHSLEGERQRRRGEAALRESEARYRALCDNLEQAVADRTRKLEDANREMEAFAYSVSHDLRAPLRAIDGFTRILVDEHGQQLNGEGRRICSVIRSNTERMAQLIEDLLAFSRLGRTEVEPCEVDMHALVRSVFDEMVAPESRQRIDFRLGELPAAHADPSLMRQVWQNLIGNAVKFSSKRELALIEVSGAADAGEMIYAVQDNGAGFDPRYAHKLFQVFERLHSTRDFDGTGVGLALVQQIIRRHGGRVWAEGEVDRGAKFCFAVPRKEP